MYISLLTYTSWSFFRSKRVLPLSIKTTQGRQKSFAGQQYFVAVNVKERQRERARLLL